MNDMGAVIAPKSEQLNNDDLLAGPRTITITKVEIRPGTEQPVSVFFEGDNGKPWKCCKSMARVLVHCWGRDANNYIGRSLTLYSEPKVTWGGLEVGGIRISHMSDIAGATTMALTVSKNNKRPFTVKPLAAVARLTAPKVTATAAPRSGGWAPLNADGGASLDPLDEPDPIEWMRNVGKAFRQATTEPEVVELAGHPSVVTALAAAPPKTKKNLNDIMQDAMDRVRQAPRDDGSSASEDPLDAMLDGDKFPA